MLLRRNLEQRSADRAHHLPKQQLGQAGRFGLEDRRRMVKGRRDGDTLTRRRSELCRRAEVIIGKWVNSSSRSTPTPTSSLIVCCGSSIPRSSSLARCRRQSATACVVSMLPPTRRAAFLDPGPGTLPVTISFREVLVLVAHVIWQVSACVIPRNRATSIEPRGLPLWLANGRPFRRHAPSDIGSGA